LLDSLLQENLLKEEENRSTPPPDKGIPRN